MLRPIDFADAYSNTNYNSDCDCNAERDSETYADAKG